LNQAWQNKLSELGSVCSDELEAGKYQLNREPPYRALLSWDSDW